MSLLVPVQVWLHSDEQIAVARSDIEGVQQLFHSSRAGLEFLAEIDLMSEAAKLVANRRCADGAIAKLKSEFGSYVQGHLNVYYNADDDFPNRRPGRNCGCHRDIVFVGCDSGPGILAHEFGHAFGLFGSYACGHANDTKCRLAFDEDNIMWQGGNYKRFTLGQVFTMHFHEDSWLNTSGVRKGETRNCTPFDSSEGCPPVDWDPFGPRTTTQ